MARLDPAPRPRRFVIVGGGFTGVATAIHLIRAVPGPMAIEIVDPAPELARGIAYSATDSLHRINVPSNKMSLFPSDVDHATLWFFENGVLPGDGTSTDAVGHYYVSRWQYGSYVQAVFRDVCAKAGARVSVRHRRCEATKVSRNADGWSVGLATGEILPADVVALCFGHRPGTPAAVAGIADDPRLVVNAWKPGALDRVDPDASVLVVGTGLTMVDFIETLMSHGHRGPITIVSRQGLMALPQGLFVDGTDLAVTSHGLPGTALGLLRLARRQAQVAVAGGLGWQPAIDMIRFNLPKLWRALPEAERRKVARRLLSFWDVHRFRAAPQPYATLLAALESGQVRRRRAQLSGLVGRPDGLVATLSTVGGRSERQSFDLVCLCTGPDRDPRRNPLVRQLIDDRLARLDAVNLGVEVDDVSRVVDAGGAATPGLYALGPMTRGTFGEMTGAPDIVRHVIRVVEDLGQQLARSVAQTEGTAKSGAA